MIKIARILAPTDLSEASLPAIRYALSLARDHRAEVFVVHATPMDLVQERISPRYIAEESFIFGGAWVPDMSRVSVDDLQRDKTRELHDFLTNRIEPELLRVVKVTPVVRLGEVVEEVVAAAKELKCDLIVMTGRERSWLGRRFSRSLTQQVVRSAPCPVLSMQPWTEIATEKGERIAVREMELANAV